MKPQNHDDAAPVNKAIILLQSDLTGLRTNTATDGWRKVLLLLTGNWSARKTSGLPFFLVEPDRHILINTPPSPTNGRTGRCSTRGASCNHSAGEKPCRIALW